MGMGIGCGWEQKWRMGNGYWAETEILRDAETQGMEMGNVTRDWNGKSRIRKEVGERDRDRSRGQVWKTSERKRQKSRIGLCEGSRQVEAQIPPSRPYYSKRGWGPLVGPALPLGRAPLPLSPACPPCSRPAVQGSPLSEF